MLILILLSSFQTLFFSLQPVESVSSLKAGVEGQRGTIFFPNLLFRICCDFLILKNLASGAQELFNTIKTITFQNYHLQHGFQQPVLKLISHDFVSLFSEFCSGIFFPQACKHTVQPLEFVADEGGK